jgi:hypothetical protein
MGFTKLDEHILQSSIMAESAVTFKIWITLLAACESNGIAYVSAVYLSSICHLPQSRVEAAIERLEGPDPHSRSLADDGRRIRRVDGGYEIINYAVYRDMSLKDAEAERKRLYRQRSKNVRTGSDAVRTFSASVSASVSASEDKKNETIRLFEEFWIAYPREGRFHKKACLQRFAELVKAGHLAELKAGFAGYLDHLKDEKLNKGFDKRPMHVMTFLNKERFKTYKDFKYEARL